MNSINDASNIIMNNQNQLQIAEKYLMSFLDSEDINKEKIVWLINHIIKRESHKLGILIDVRILTLEDYIKLKNKYKTIEQCTYEYNRMNGSYTKKIDKNDIIDIHIDTFEDFCPLSVYEIIETCYHELKHAKKAKYIEIRKKENRPLSLYDYNSEKEKFALLFEYNILYNHESEAELDGHIKARSFCKKYAPKLYEKIQDYSQKQINEALCAINLEIDNSTIVHEILDNIVIDKIRLVSLATPNYTFLSYEYNNNVDRKRLIDIIRASLNPQQQNMIKEEVYMSIINDYLDEINIFELNSLIKNINYVELEQLNKGINWGKEKYKRKRNINDIYLKHGIIGEDDYAEYDSTFKDKFVKLLMKQNAVVEKMLSYNNVPDSTVKK